MMQLSVTCEAVPTLGFQPTRSDMVDSGRFEVWREGAHGVLENGSVGLVPTGGWIVWDSETNELVLGFPNPIAAEMLAVLRNEGAETRIMDPWSGERWSELDFANVKSIVEAEEQRVREASPELFANVQ